MLQNIADLEIKGIRVVDIDAGSMLRDRPRRVRTVSQHLERMEKIARAFASGSDAILQELVNAAVELCEADSAGISVEREGRTDDQFYHWVATAGQYSEFTNAVLPRYPSACGVCLERGKAQFFQVGQEFFDIMGISAPLVTDGLLLPWVVDDTRGTIFVMAHGRKSAFDAEDSKVMHVLANFAAMAIKQQKQQKLIVEQARLAAAIAMANELAHKINNPLQSLTNVLYLASEGHNGDAAIAVGRAASDDLDRLSRLVKELLALPFRPA